MLFYAYFLALSSVVFARPAPSPHPPFLPFPMQLSLPSFVSILALSLFLPLPSVSATGADPIIFPDPSPEAFRALSVLVNLLGTLLAACRFLPSCISLTLPRRFYTLVLYCKENSRLQPRWLVARPSTIFPKASNPRPQPHFLAPPSRWILIATFIDSWIFIFSSALMISGVGLSFSQETCRGAIFLCIVFYASSKVLVYSFLGPFYSPALTQ